jgi:mono/diheme cytochrome c family protein
VAVDLGDRVGVLQPLATGALCTSCHGTAERVPDDVKAFLRAAYPGDNAFGFAEGDLRGFVWAEAPRKEGPLEPSTAEAPDGATLFATANPRCSVCHSIAGQGNPKGPLDGVGGRLSREEIAAWIREPAVMAARRGGTRKPAMVRYLEYSDEEVRALVDYLAKLPPRGVREP